MRFLVMVKANADSEAGKLPSTELLTAMGKYNEELVKAGVLLAAEGLQPSAKGARIEFSGNKRTVRILPRGNWQDESGEPLQAALPEFLTQGTPRSEQMLNRLDLARWIVSRDNRQNGVELLSSARMHHAVTLIVESRQSLRMPWQRAVR